MPRTSRPGGFGTGFLLSQLGAHSAARFAEAIAALGISPPHVGLLRAVTAAPGRSQQELAEQFGIVPSRMVVLLDELEDRRLVERRRDAADRRVHLVHPTDAGRELLTEVLAIGDRAEQRLLAPLSAAERRQLTDLLQRLAAAAELAPGVHPGYRYLRGGGHPPGDPHHDPA